MNAKTTATELPNATNDQKPPASDEGSWRRTSPIAFFARNAHLCRYHFGLLAMPSAFGATVQKSPGKLEIISSSIAFTENWAFHDEEHDRTKLNTYRT